MAPPPTEHEPAFQNDVNDRWSAYRTTVFDVQAGAERLFEELGPVAIVTAWKPGRLLPREENVGRDRGLQATLVERGIPHLRVVRRSPDGEHGEASWAVRCPDEVTLELARTFGQEAVYLMREEALVLLGCEAGAEEVRLGGWRQRLVRTGEAASEDR